MKLSGKEAKKLPPGVWTVPVGALPQLEGGPSWMKVGEGAPGVSHTARRRVPNAAQACRCFPEMEAAVAGSQHPAL